MDDNMDLQAFDLDDILNEFQDVPPAEGDLETISEELGSLLGDWGSAKQPEPDRDQEQPEEISMDTAGISALIEELADMNEISRPVTEPAPEAEAAAPDTIRMEALISGTGEEPETLSDEATIRMDILPVEKEEGLQETAEPTIRMDLTDDALMNAVAAEMETAVPAQQEAARILYNPRTRLRELKKKLVAGPEKRYYELTECGVGRLQIAILLSLVLVVLCALVTILYSLNMIPENRLRFVIFSQVLAMLLSAFLGCQQMMDGWTELFKGHFTVNTLLNITFVACCADAVFCLSELRIPCCAAFSLEIAMALWARYQRISTEMAQMDSLRKAVRLHAVVKQSDFYEGKPGILRREGEVEDFMNNYNKVSGPQRVQNIYALAGLLLCAGIAVFTGMTHGVSLGLQIFSAALMVAVPASFFVALSRPASLMQRRLHMVGTVFCGWKGVKGLCGKAVFPVRDEDLFPVGSTKLNGVKYYGDRNPDEILAYSASLIRAAGGGLVGVFEKALSDRDGREYPVAAFRDYGSGGVGGEIREEPVLLGTLDFLQDMGVEIPEGTMVSQAVYVAIDGQLCAVFAISYAKMRSSAAGIISLCGTRKVTAVLTGNDFMLTSGLLRAKFSVNTRRIQFPDQETRRALAACQPDEEAPALALATRDDLAAYAYAVSGARSLRTATRLGVAVHLIGGITGILIMAAVAILGMPELLTPIHILLYQLVWMVPGLLITEWARMA